MERTSGCADQTASAAAADCAAERAAATCGGRLLSMRRRRLTGERPCLCAHKVEQSDTVVEVKLQLLSAASEWAEEAERGGSRRTVRRRAKSKPNTSAARCSAAAGLGSSVSENRQCVVCRRGEGENGGAARGRTVSSASPSSSSLQVSPAPSISSSEPEDDMRAAHRERLGDSAAIRVRRARASHPRMHRQAFGARETSTRGNTPWGGPNGGLPSLLVAGLRPARLLNATARRRVLASQPRQAARLLCAPSPHVPRLVCARLCARVSARAAPLPTAGPALPPPRA